MPSGRPRINLFTLAGGALILVGLLAILVFLNAQRAPSMDALVPKETIPPYVTLSVDQFTTVKILKNDATSKLLTRQALDDLVKKNPQGGVFSSVPLVTDQPVMTTVLLTEATRSAKIVSPDERVIAVIADAAGAVGRNLSPGNVVDVQLAASSSLSAGTGTSTRAKVIAAGSAEEIAQALEPGKQVPDTKTTNDLVLLIAVPADSAPSLAGQKVTFSLNVFCTVQPDGKIAPVNPSTNATTCQ